MKVYVIDNGGQWTHREWRVLRYLGAEAEMISNETPVEKLADADAIVLSGGAPRIGTEALKLGNSAQYIDELDIPILGICVGCQFIAIHFGGKADAADVPEFGKTEVVVEDNDAILAGLPEKFIAWESHNDEIKELPDVLKGLAHSENCQYQAIRHEKRPIFGLQFHPEVEHTEYGDKIFSNFLEEIKK